MELIRLLSWAVLVNALTSMFPYGGDCMLMNMPFRKAWTHGTYISFGKTLNRVRSNIHCAILCKKNREMMNTIVCHGYLYHDEERTCDLYNLGTSFVYDGKGVEIYVFRSAGVFHVVSVNGKQYSVYKSDVKMVYFDARTYCHDLGGFLLEFNSMDEYEAVKMVGFGDTQFAFVGANELNVEGEWVTDRRSQPIFSPDSGLWVWEEGQPNDSGSYENCLVVSTHHPRGAYDFNCGSAITFLCEKDIY